MKTFSRIEKLLAYICIPVIFVITGYFAGGCEAQAKETGYSYIDNMVNTKGSPDQDTDTDTSLVHTDEEEPYIRIEDIEFPVTGTQYGQIECERIELDAPVYWYDTNEILAYGVGQSIASFLPGFGRVIILSAHNTTFFRCLEYVEEGDVICFNTNYFPYEYTVTKVEVLDENAFADILLEKIEKEQEELIMYTCYPFYPIVGRRTQRLVAYAERTKGVNVKWRNLEEPSTEGP